MNAHGALRTTILFFLFGLVVAVQAQTPETHGEALNAWGDTLSLDARVIGEIAKFDKGKGNFEPGYAEAIALGVRHLVFAGLNARLDSVLADKCGAFIDVTFLDPGFAVGEEPQGKPKQKFERSFVRTEVLACFTGANITPEAALRMYTNPEFRQKVASRIERIWDEEGENCVETKGVAIVLSPMKNCSRITELHRPGLAVQHSQTVSNPGGDDFQTVYFKESVKTFISVPGGLVLHYINYSRTTGLGGLKKRIARGKLIDSQEKAITELEAMLANLAAGE